MRSSPIPEETIRRRNDVDAVDFDGGLALIDQARDRLIVCNESAATIWHGIARETTISQLSAALAAHYEIDPEHADNDVRTVVADWHNEGLLTGALPLLPKAAVADRAGIGTAPLSVSRHHAGQLTFELETDVADVQRRVGALFPAVTGAEPEIRFAVLRDRDTRGVVFSCSDAAPSHSESSEEALGTMFMQLFQALYPDTDWLAMLHGGAVAKDNSALAIVGPSGSGKSTFAACLLQKGYSFISDDVLALRSGGGAAAWPAALSLKKGSWAPLVSSGTQLEAAREVTFGERRMKYIQPPSFQVGFTPISHIIFPAYRERAEPCALALRPLHALARLLQDRIWLGFPFERWRVRRFLDWLGETPAFELRYSSFEDAETLLAGVLHNGAH